MNQKTRYKSALINSLIVSFCLVVCAGSLWLFWVDLNTSSVRNDKNQIATISFKYKIAQRKFMDRVVWERLQNDNPLYDGDTIRTSEGSSATIAFDNGILVDVRENSMIQIAYTQEGLLKLNVSSDGSDIQIDTTAATESVSIQMASGVSVDVESGSKLIAKNDETGDAPSLQVLAGNAQVQSETGEKATVSTGESVKVSKDGKVNKSVITVTSISDNYRVLNFEKKPLPILLEWACSSNAENAQNEEATPKQFVIQVSPTKDFKEISRSYDVDNENFQSVEFNNGANYWKIYEKQAPQDFVSGKVVVDYVEPFATTSPDENALFKYYSKNPKIRFMWAKNQFALKYKIEIARDIFFKDVVLSEEVRSTSANYSSLEEGKYYWRVTPYYQNGGIGYFGESQTKSFTVVKDVLMMKPNLVLPVEDAKFVYDGEKFNINFQWKCESEKDNYVLEFSKNADFSSIMESVPVSEKRVDVELATKDFEQGKYYWRVRNVEQNELLSAAELKQISSEARSFYTEKFIQKKSRLLYPKDGFIAQGTELKNQKFFWEIGSYKPNDYSRFAANENGEKKVCKIQFSKDASFDQIELEKKTSESSISNLNLPSGQYYWRVEINQTRSDGTTFAETTNSNSILVVDEIASAQILAPQNGEKLVLNENQSVRFEWQEVENCEFYNVSLFNENDELLKNWEIKEQNSVSLVLSDLDEKNAKSFKLSVQSVGKTFTNGKTQYGITCEASFTARLCDHVTLQNPAGNTQIAGLTAAKNGVTFSWKNGLDTPNKNQFMLWKIQANGKQTLVKKVDNAKNSVFVNHLEEGRYYWSVKASSKSGLVLDAKERNEFTVTSVPKLARARLTQPENKFVIGPTYLRENKAILFNWQNVTDATEYDFVLYQKLSDGKLKKVYEQKGVKNTSVKLNDLTILDVGKFEWQVQSFSYAKDGYLLQKSDVSASEFEISFEKPKVELVDPGVMYVE